MNFNLLRSKRIGLDIGNNNTLVSDTEQVLLNQPSYIVFNERKGSVQAVGADAFRMFEKSHEDLRTVKPLKGGVVADYASASAMVHAMVDTSLSKMPFYEGLDVMISGVPFTTSNVERRALTNILEEFGARKTFLVFEPIAAALGMGLNIQEPKGKMVVDIGGGITEIVVISLSGIASFESLKIAGDSMDMSIQDYFRRHYQMAIGLKTAEQIKIKVGAVGTPEGEQDMTMQVVGKDCIRGIPVQRKIGWAEISEVLETSITSIEQSIVQALEKCPPELSGDIGDEGIYVTGGNAYLRGLKERFERRLRVPIHIDRDPLCAVTKGVSVTLKNPDKYRSILIS